MLEPGPYKLHLPPVHFGPMDLMTMTHQEAVDQLVEGAEEDLIQLADLYFDSERVQNALITKHPILWLLKCQTVTNIISIFYFSFGPLYFKKTHSVLIFISLTIHLLTKCIMGKKIYLLKFYLLLWLDMLDQKCSEENMYLVPN